MFSVSSTRSSWADDLPSINNLSKYNQHSVQSTQGTQYMYIILLGIIDKQNSLAPAPVQVKSLDWVIVTTRMTTYHHPALTGSRVGEGRLRVFLKFASRLSLVSV